MYERRTILPIRCGKKLRGAELCIAVHLLCTVCIPSAHRRTDIAVGRAAVTVDRRENCRVMLSSRSPRCGHREVGCRAVFMFSRQKRADPRTVSSRHDVPRGAIDRYRRRLPRSSLEYIGFCCCAEPASSSGFDAANIVDVATRQRMQPAVRVVDRQIHGRADRRTRATACIARA